jgi:hypothetical protein
MKARYVVHSLPLVKERPALHHKARARGNVNDHEAKEIVYKYTAFIAHVKRAACFPVSFVAGYRCYTYCIIKPMV